MSVNAFVSVRQNMNMWTLPKTFIPTLDHLGLNLGILDWQSYNFTISQILIFIVLTHISNNIHILEEQDEINKTLT